MDEKLIKLYNDKQFEQALELISNQTTGDLYLADSLTDYIHRYYMEYPLEQGDVCAAIKARGFGCTLQQLKKWQDLGHLEYLHIDGRKRYFKNSVRNLFLLDDSLRHLVQDQGLNDESLSDFRVDHIREILNLKRHQPLSVNRNSVEMVLNYSVKVDSDAVPAGTRISAWLPFGVRDGAGRQEISLIRCSPADCIISQDDFMHQSVYQEVVQEEGGAEFSETISLKGHARYFNPDILSKTVFSKLPDSVLGHVGERTPHIIFSNEIRSLADSLVSPEMNPYEMVKCFYYWIDQNIPWASAVEYALIDNIPQYTLRHGHGDCGMQTLLFMTLCRYKGIPARWRSGWMLHPGHVNLHDWCEVWYDNIGWVPVDVSFKLQKSDDQRVREFYISGMDAYRFLVNKDYGQSFSPPKKWPRSEPWDFQRGELEWDGGNIYFDQWSGTMSVSYLNGSI